MCRVLLSIGPFSWRIRIKSASPTESNIFGFQSSCCAVVDSHFFSGSGEAGKLGAGKVVMELAY